MKNAILIIFTLSFSALAEYRVYQYNVQDKLNGAKAQILLSSLNPVAYLAYNGGSNLVSIDLLRTWLCPGNTAFKKPICKSPYQIMQESEEQ